MEIPRVRDHNQVEPVEFTNFTRTTRRTVRVVQDPQLDAFAGETGAEGLEPLLGLIAEVLDMGLVLVGHVNREQYSVVASYATNPELTMEKGATIPIGDTYCREEITASAPFVLADAAVHPRFRTHPGFTRLGLRSYVGVPLILEDGTLYGTLCGVDTAPRTVTPEMVERLLLLAGTLSVEISRRLGLKGMTEAERALARANDELKRYVRHVGAAAAERENRIGSLTRALTDVNRRQAETIRRLRRANEELEEWTYTVSHDLSEPLRGVETLSHYLAEEAPQAPRDELAETARRVYRESLRVKARIEGMLEFSRVVRADFEVDEVDVAGLVREIVDGIFLRVEEARAEVVIQDAPPLPRLRSERVRLEQIFLNLIENALKYNPDANLRVEVGCREDGKEHVFWVKDDGVGIPIEYHGRIFNIFQRGPADSTRPGTGMGLAIVKRVVERHGGRVWVESAPGQGATFYFTVPGTSSADGDGDVPTRVLAE